MRRFILQHSERLINKDLDTISAMLRDEWSRYDAQMNSAEVKRPTKFCRTFIQKIARSMGFMMTRHYGLVHVSLKHCMKMRKRGAAVFKKKRAAVSDQNAQSVQIQRIIQQTETPRAS